MKVSRRQALLFLLAALSGCTKTASAANNARAGGKKIPVLLTPEMTEGPFYVTNHLLRRDIREDRAGVPLTLNIALRDAKTGLPLKHAAVDIWHCDATGNYSGYAQEAEAMAHHRPGHFPPPPVDMGKGATMDMPPHGRPPMGLMGMPPHGIPPHLKPSDNNTFLRGTQISDANGLVQFQTIYPGWYEGRTLHIHMKVHCGATFDNGNFVGSHVSHTGQLFLPKAVTAAVAKQAPYSNYKGECMTLAEDMIYQNQHGAAGMMTVAVNKQGGGYAAHITLGINPEATPAQV